MNIFEIKEFASNFDLNPKINFELFVYLKKYSSNEYKNTLKNINIH